MLFTFLVPTNCLISFFPTNFFFTLIPWSSVLVSRLILNKIPETGNLRKARGLFSTQLWRFMSEIRLLLWTLVRVVDSDGGACVWKLTLPWQARRQTQLAQVQACLTIL